VDDYRSGDDFSESDALEVFARQLGEKSFECEVIDAASNAFARRILGCSTIEQAQNEARGWLGIEATF
jgi:hypothetical protein